MASKQHNNSNNKPLACKRLDFTDSAFEYDKLLEYSNCLHKRFWISRFFTSEQTSGRFGVYSIFPRTHLQGRFHKGSMCTYHWGGLGFGSFSIESSEVTNGRIKENKSLSIFWFSEFLRCLLFRWRWWTRDNETTPLYTNLDQHSRAHFKENLNFESAEHKGGRKKSSHCASFLYMCRKMSCF